MSLDTVDELLTKLSFLVEEDEFTEKKSDLLSALDSQFDELNKQGLQGDPATPLAKYVAEYKVLKNELSQVETQVSPYYRSLNKNIEALTNSLDPEHTADRQRLLLAVKESLIHLKNVIPTLKSERYKTIYQERILNAERTIHSIGDQPIAQVTTSVPSRYKEKLAAIAHSVNAPSTTGNISNSEEPISTTSEPISTTSQKAK